MRDATPNEGAPHDTFCTAIAARRDFDSRATVIELNDLIDPAGRRPEAQPTPVEQIEANGSPTRRIAHDFNNLLGIITLNLELARERAGGEVREMIDEALDAAWQGSELAGHLAGFAWSRPGLGRADRKWRAGCRGAGRAGFPVRNARARVASLGWIRDEDGRYYRDR